MKSASLITDVIRQIVFKLYIIINIINIFNVFLSLNIFFCFEFVIFF